MRRARARGISSIYGFLMIFLLSMASIQTWSTAVGSITQLQAASDQSHQIEQMQGIEHLSLSTFEDNLTVANDGQIPSTVLYIRLVGPNDSRTIPLGEQIKVGGSLQLTLDTSGQTVEAVTSLGNVFVMRLQTPDPGALSFWTGQSGPEGNVQLYRSPAYPSDFYLGSGAWVYAFNNDGSLLWSFDAGEGLVTDVMPLSSGDVYVSVGYQSPPGSALLYELAPGGGVLSSIPVRLYQTVDEPLPLEVPVSKGESLQYAFYDGWFYNSAGTVASVPSDGFPLAASDGSDFYFYQSIAEGSYSGGCNSTGDEVRITSFSPSSPTGFPNWTDFESVGECDEYPPQMVAATAGNGTFATIFSEDAYVGADGSSYPAQDPYLMVLSSEGAVLYTALLPTGDYSSVATSGADVYLALPQSGQIQVVDLATGTSATYSVGFQVSQLQWSYGSLFAISSSEVKVYSGAMSLQKAMVFAPFELGSSSNGFFQESTLQAPSFLPLNSTSYAVLLENSTGYVTMAIGEYA